MRSGGLDSVLAAESADGRSRLVLNLDRTDALPDPRGRQSHLRDCWARAPPVRRRRGCSSRGQLPRRHRPAAGRGIQSIDFRRATDGSATGRLIVKLDDPRIPVNLQPAGQPASWWTSSAPICPQHLQRRFDVVRLRHAGHRLRRDALRPGARSWSCRPPVISSSWPTRPTTSTWSKSSRAAQARVQVDGKAGLHRRAHDRQLPGHRYPHAAAADRRYQRPQHRRSAIR